MKEKNIDNILNKLKIEAPSHNLAKKIIDSAYNINIKKKNSLASTLVLLKNNFINTFHLPRTVIFAFSLAISIFIGFNNDLFNFDNTNLNSNELLVSLLTIQGE